MDKLRNAAVLALESLELLSKWMDIRGMVTVDNELEAITALRSALNARSSSTHSDAEYSEVAQHPMDYDREFWGDGQDHSEQHLNMVQGGHKTDGTPCWCNPEVTYENPETGAKVIVHKEPPVVQQGCSYCNSHLFAGTKCNNCGKVFESVAGSDDDTDKAAELVWHMQAQLEAMRIETLENAAKVCEDCSDHIVGNDLAAAIRSMK